MTKRYGIWCGCGTIVLDSTRGGKTSHWCWCPRHWCLLPRCWSPYPHPWVDQGAPFFLFLSLSLFIFIFTFLFLFCFLSLAFLNIMYVGIGSTKSRTHHCSVWRSDSSAGLRWIITSRCEDGVWPWHQGHRCRPQCRQGDREVSSCSLFINSYLINCIIFPNNK